MDAVLRLVVLWFFVAVRSLTLVSLGLSQLRDRTAFLDSCGARMVAMVGTVGTVGSWSQTTFLGAEDDPDRIAWPAPCSLTRGVEVPTEVNECVRGQVVEGLKGVLVAASIDTVSLSLWVDFDGESFGASKEVWDRVKEGYEKEWLSIGEYVVGVFPNGDAKAGWAYIVETAGCKFYLSTKAIPHEARANVRVDVGSATCMQLGAAGVRAIIADFLQVIGGGAIRREVLGRLDFAFDLGGLAMGELAESIEGKAFSTRAQNIELRYKGRRLETLNVGLGGQVMCRIYDKGAELKAKPNAAKEEILFSRWGGATVATRVEFQLRRKALKEFGVNTLDDWQSSVRGVLLDLLEWLRVYDVRGFDKSHLERSTIHPVWQGLIAYVEQWNGVERVKRTRKRARCKAQLESNAAGLTGHLKTLLAGCTGVKETDLARCVLGLLGEIAAQPGFWSDVEERRAEFVNGWLPECGKGSVGGWQTAMVHTSEEVRRVLGTLYGGAPIDAGFAEVRKLCRAVTKDVFESVG